MTNLLFSLLTIPVFFINTVLCVSPFAQLVSTKTKKLLYGLYAALGISNAALYYVVAALDRVSFAFVKYSVFLVVLLVTLINIFVIRGYVKEHIFSCGLATLFNYMSASVGVYLTYQFFGWDSLESCVCIEALSIILIIACYWPAHRLMIHTVRPFLAIDSGRYWHAVWFIPFLMLFACYFSLPGNSHITHFSQVLGRFCLMVVAFFVCRIIAEDVSRFQEKQAMTEQLNQQKLYYTEMRLEVEKARRNQHDLKHHLAAIQHYLETDNKEGLLEYCSELLTQNEIRGQLPYSGNSAADGVIYHYMGQSREHQIRFTYQGTIRSNGIADTDLCVLLGNALDNALAGCMTVPENRFIRVTAQSEKQLLSILIQNSFDGIVEENEKGLLSRKRKNRQGIGFDSMNAVCQSYGGTIERSWDEKTFTICILLPLKPRDDGSHT